MLMIFLPLVVAVADLPLIDVHAGVTEIRESARIRIAADVVRDQGGRGVIHIIGDEIAVDFGSEHLRGSPPGTDPDAYSGIGVRISGRNVRLEGGRFSGFKVAIHAEDADGLHINGADASDNFRQRLRSTPQAEATEDWLWPHRNDEKQWMHNYGAGIYVERSENVTIRNVIARNVQNGIVLDRVNDSRIFDNDCSFLSGWGLAMWRSNRNTISRNAFDFCVRGYSHGVYNRGQDSAGILMFEQCSENTIVQNSATHGGDGLFGFAGLEALGEKNPRDDTAWYEGRGNNRNRIFDNDFSYAVAHGLEMTFSFDNHIAGNRFVGNAICGIWGGVSQRFMIHGNTFESNGEMPYGLERGGVNIEHGVGHSIEGNTFRNNACGVHLWDRPENRYAHTPWGRVNDPRSRDNRIARNRFERDQIAVHLRNVGRTIVFDNAMQNVDVEIEADEASRAAIGEADGDDAPTTKPRYQAIGRSQPIGARAELAGREHIVMTEWGPYDYQQPLLHLRERGVDQHVYRLLGAEQPTLISLLCKTLRRDEGNGAFVALERDQNGTLSVRTGETNRAVPYRLIVLLPSGELRADDVLVPAAWRVRVFAWETDPRADVERWRAEAADGVAFISPHLQLRYGHGGPSQLPDAPTHLREAEMPVDRFGTIAEATLTFPPGRWRIRTVSDDGIRVWLNDEKVIDDWTHHAPREHSHELAVDEVREISLRVEHFELDGYAILTLDIESVEP